MTRPQPLPSRRRVRLALIVAAIGLLSAGGAGTAFAVSGGGYAPYQQGCQPTDDDYATPTGQTYPGCHNLAVNVESGGTSQGDPSDTNTKFAQVGLDQVPNDPNSQGTPTPYSIGEPGSSGSPHAGCVAVNTDGTGGQPAPAGAPEPAGQAENTPYGCGNNPAGAGFSSNFDYYQYFCPIAATLGFGCEAPSGGTTTVTPDSGQSVALQPLIDNGVLVYYGMDDNSDNGEHDGLGPFEGSPAGENIGAVNGPSDGGAIMAVVTPAAAASTPSQAHPEGAANASSGFCADGICTEATTSQQTVYHGCGAADSSGQAPCGSTTPQQANVYDYAPGGDPANDPSVTESPNCNSGGPQNSGPSACGPGGMNALRSATPANENAEPGVQLYADPDPQRSPAAPAPLWPTPAVYVGSPATTGQVLGGSPLTIAGVPVTNAAGQVAVDPQPSAC